MDGVVLTGTWKMRGGLAGEHLSLPDPASSATTVPWAPVAAGATSTKSATWYKASFATPGGVSDSGSGEQLLLHAAGLDSARGRFWVNGHEVSAV
jgi:hypothetical protein